MPRSSRGPYLWKRSARKRNGVRIASAIWIIRDGRKHTATGCLAYPTEQGPSVAAREALTKYIAQQYSPSRRLRALHEILVADVLAIYYRDTGERQSSQRRFASWIARLNAFFGHLKLTEINTGLCKAYAATRSKGGARRDLEDLRSAINHHSKDNLHDGIVRVWLPAKGAPRERWLTRSDVARLLLACRRAREEQTLHRGPNKGQIIKTTKRPLKHLARFILLGLYTGTRASSIALASPKRIEGRSYVDLDQGVFYRLPIGNRKTNKRQPPVPIPPRLLSHMRRWVKLSDFGEYFVEWQGKPIQSVKTAFARAVTLAGLDTERGNITPHTLRHTAATWLMQNGADPWQASGFLGMSVKTLIEVYGHHHPDHMREAALAISGKGRSKNVVVVERVVEIDRLSRKSQK